MHLRLLELDAGACADGIDEVEGTELSIISCSRLFAKEAIMEGESSFDSISANSSTSMQR